MSAAKSSRRNDRLPITVSFSGTSSCLPEHIQWCDHGVTLHTQWYFRQGSEVEFGVELDRKRHCCSGIVVDCESLDEPGHYVMTLYFIETPCEEIRHAARCLCGEPDTIPAREVAPPSIPLPRSRR